MAKKTEKTESLNPEVLQEKLIGAEHWIEKNPKPVIIAAVVIAVVVGGFFGFKFYQERRNQEALAVLSPAVFLFEKDSFDLALKGDGNNLGFINIIDEYSFTQAAKLANFYAGVSYLKQGKFELARLYLEDFSSTDILVQARAYAAIGDTYMEEDKFEDAIKYYTKAAEYKSNKFFSPTYLIKKGLAQEKSGNKEDAIKTYDEIITKYWDSPELQTAKKLKARLEKNS